MSYSKEWVDVRFCFAKHDDGYVEFAGVQNKERSENLSNNDIIGIQESMMQVDRQQIFLATSLPEAMEPDVFIPLED